MRSPRWLSPLLGVWMGLYAPQLWAAPPDDEDAEKEAPDADEDAEAEADADIESEPEISTKKAKKKKSKKGGLSGGSGMKGRVGILGQRTLSGLNGLGVRYYLADKLTLGLTAGFATFSHKEPNDNGDFEQTNTVGLMGIGPSVFFWPVQGDRNNVVHADFGVGTRATVFMGFTGANDDDAEDTLNDPIELDIEIPLTVQLFIGERVAIAPEFGFAIRWVPGSREPDSDGNFDANPGSGVGSRLGTTDGPGWGFELGSTSGVFLGLNVGYYFGKTK